jgi:hypothetical protein
MLKEALASVHILLTTNYTGRQKNTLFLLPVKIQGGSYSFDITESKYDNPIAPSTHQF